MSPADYADALVCLVALIVAAGWAVADWLAGK